MSNDNYQKNFHNVIGAIMAEIDSHFAEKKQTINAQHESRKCENLQRQIAQLKIDAEQHGKCDNKKKVI